MYNTGLHVSTFFQVTEKWVKVLFYIFHAEHEYQSSFFLSLQVFSKILCQKYKKVHKYRFIWTAITLSSVKFFNVFLDHTVDRMVGFDITENSWAITLLFLKKSLNNFWYCIFNGKTCIRLSLRSFFLFKLFPNVRI